VGVEIEMLDRRCVFDAGVEGGAGEPKITDATARGYWAGDHAANVMDWVFD
jgi:hypothetical protein